MKQFAAALGRWQEARGSVAKSVERPRVWNPSKASYCAVLLSPIVGSFMVASNWREMQRPGEAVFGWIWFALLATVTVLGMLSDFMPELHWLSENFRSVMIASVAGWYCSTARRQIRVFKAMAPTDYISRSLMAPIAFAVLALVAMILAFSVAMMADGFVRAGLLSESLKPEIQAELRRKHGRSLVVESLTLVHSQGNSFKGILKVKYDRQTRQFDVEVTSDNNQTIWKANPVGSQDVIEPLGRVERAPSIGWTVAIPSGWTKSSEEEAERIFSSSMTREQFEAKKLEPIFVVRKGANAIIACTEAHDESTMGPWRDALDASYEMIERGGFKVLDIRRGTEKIDGVEFVTSSFRLEPADGDGDTLYQWVFVAMVKGRMLTVSAVSKVQSERDLILVPVVRGSRFE